MDEIFVSEETRDTVTDEFLHGSLIGCGGRNKKELKKKKMF
jgi:hypothetical protein